MKLTFHQKQNGKKMLKVIICVWMDPFMQWYDNEKNNSAQHDRATMAQVIIQVVLNFIN